MSLELNNVPEAQALDTLLRAVSGYLAAPRAVVAPNASAYDRIFILATSTGTPARPRCSRRRRPRPRSHRRPFVAPPQDDQNADDEPPQRGAPPVPANAPRGPGFNTFPRPLFRSRPPPPTQDQPRLASFPAPTSPVGVSTPGMAMPTPQQQPGQSPNPGQSQNPGQATSPGQSPNQGTNVR